MPYSHLSNLIILICLFSQILEKIFTTRRVFARKPFREGEGDTIPSLIESIGEQFLKRKVDNLTRSKQFMPVGKGIVIAPIHLGLIVLICVLLVAVSYLRGSAIGRDQAQTNTPSQAEITPNKIPTPTFAPTKPIAVPQVKPTVTPSSPKPTSTPSTSPSKVVDADPQVNCTFTGSCAGTYQMSSSACSNSACCQIDGKYQVATIADCNAAYQKELDAYQKSLDDYYAQVEADSAAVQQQVDETNAKLLELCRENARKMYPEYPAGESPEHRNQRMQALNNCFNEYGQ